MEKFSTINKKKEMPKGTVVATIRERKITKEDLDSEIRKLPSYVQEMYKEDSKKAEFLKQFVATELMYDSAKRKNFDNDKEIIKKAFEAKRSFMVQKLFEEEVIDTKKKILNSLNDDCLMSNDLMSKYF